MLRFQKHPLTSYFYQFFAQRYSISGDSLQAKRERILLAMLLGLCFLGIAVYSLNFFAVIQMERWSLAILYTLSYFFLIGVTFVRRVPYSIRAYTLVVMPYILALAFMVDNGLIGDGLLWMVFSPVMASVLFGLREGIVALFAGLCILAGLGWLFSTETMSLSFMPLMVDSTQPLAWITTGVDFFGLTGAAVVSLGVLINQLESTIEREKALSTELQQRTHQIERLNQDYWRAREAERKFVSHELHDEIIQELVVLKMNLGKMDCNHQEINHKLLHLLENARRICSDLRPPALDNLGLIPAIRARIREVENQSNVKCILRLTGEEDQDLPENVRLTFYRILQEGLLNVIKHANASLVNIDLRIYPDFIQICIEDDGKGFRLPEDLGNLIDQDHFGLVGLRERLEGVKGRLGVYSTPGQGTRLEAQAPLLDEYSPMRQSDAHITKGDLTKIRHEV